MISYARLWKLLEKRGYAAMFHRPEVLIATPTGYVVLPAGAADEIQADSE